MVKLTNKSIIQRSTIVKVHQFSYLQNYSSIWFSIVYFARWSIVGIWILLIISAPSFDILCLVFGARIFIMQRTPFSIAIKAIQTIYQIHLKCKPEINVSEKAVLRFTLIDLYIICLMTFKFITRYADESK